MSRNPYTALDKLWKELQAYIKFNINSPPKNNIYILLWRHKNLTIQLEGTLIAAFSKIAKSGIKEAILIILFSPLNSNS